MEVFKIPLTVRVAGEKDTDNTPLIMAICDASRLITPSLQISRIRWLHNPNRPVRNAGGKLAKTQGSLIIKVPTQEI